MFKLYGVNLTPEGVVLYSHRLVSLYNTLAFTAYSRLYTDRVTQFFVNAQITTWMVVWGGGSTLLVAQLWLLHLPYTTNKTQKKHYGGGGQLPALPPPPAPSIWLR